MYDWQFSDEILTYEIPFVYFMHQNFLKIISPLTNKIVRNIDFSQDLISKHPKLFSKRLSQKDIKKGVFNIFNKMQMSHYLEVYLTSSKIDCTYFMRLDDDNDDLLMKVRD